MTGQITTCYSFKGGSGRSMSVANLAWALATRGRRVLVVDWDLEAPGVHRYFHPFLEDPLQQDSEGLIDGLWAYVQAIPDGAAKQVAQWAAMGNYTQSLNLPLIRGGAIDLLGAGRQDDSYTRKVGNFDWQMFYAKLGGKTFIDHFGSWARKGYDHILIDSRTGVSDTAGICTMQLPDVLALFFVYNRQSIEGVAAAGRAVRANSGRKIRIIPCPSRVEDKRIAESARHYAALCLEDVFDEKPDPLNRTLRVHELMHFPWCAYEEKLAIFEEEPDEAGTLLQATDLLSTRIAGPIGQEPEFVDKERLASYWRRAAFRDPRMAHLEVLRSASLSQKIPQLKLWLGETLEEQAPSVQWQLTLAHECVALAAAASTLLNPADIDKLGQGAIDLIRQMIGRRSADHVAAAEVLRSRAQQLVRVSRLDEAEALIAEAVGLLEHDLKGHGRTVLARALEVEADIYRLKGDYIRSLDTTTRLVALQEMGTRTDKGNGREARARAYRLRASVLFALERFDAAEEEAEHAFRIARQSRDNSPEPALARLLAVKAALARARLR